MTDPKTQAAWERPPVDILFICGVFGSDEEAFILDRSRGPAQFAANALQWNIIRGLDQACGRPIRLLSALFVGSYPLHYRDLILQSRRWSHAPGAQDAGVGFLNLWAVKHVSRAFAVAREVVAWAGRAEARDAPQAIIIYAVHSPFLYGALRAKASHPAIRICLIVPDLPQFMNLTATFNPVRWLLSRLERMLLHFMVKKVDAFVLLTKAMAGPLAVGPRPWIVMEGMTDQIDAAAPGAGPGSAGGEHIILYSGTLTLAYGIKTLLQAFRLLTGPDYRLWVCGAGEAEAEIRDLAQTDPRVRFFGQRPREEVIALQKQATLLINPRGPSGEFTKYSFPSKVMEYMASGTPTLIQRLPGIPEEYFDYVYTIDQDTPKAMAAAIRRVCALPAADRRQRAAAARAFISSRKNHVVQSRRIHQLVCDLFH